MMLHGREPVKALRKPMELCFRPPVPAKPRMVDFHELPSSVFSRKIYNVLQPMNIYGLQLLPATVRGKKDERYEDYWVTYVYNRIACLDVEHSQYDIDEDDGDISNILRFFLVKETLAEIPLEKRLVFLLAEWMSSRLYHKSVVADVMPAHPVRIQLYPIQDWYEGIQFDDEEEDW